MNRIKLKTLDELVLSNTGILKLVGSERKITKLKTDEFYTLMVVSFWEKHPNDNIVGYDKEIGNLIGLQCTSEHKIYISKIFHNIKDENRGTTLVVKIDMNKIKEFCLLEY